MQKEYHTLEDIGNDASGLFHILIINREQNHTWELKKFLVDRYGELCTVRIDKNTVAQKTFVVEYASGRIENYMLTNYCATDCTV